MLIFLFFGFYIIAGNRLSKQAIFQSESSRIQKRISSNFISSQYTFNVNNEPKSLRNNTKLLFDIFLTFFRLKRTGAGDRRRVA